MNAEYKLFIISVMGKYIASGILISILIGFILKLIYPNLLYYDVFYQILLNKQLGYPADYYSAQGGSFLTGGGLVIIFFAIVGSLVGIIVYKIKNLIRK